MLRRAHAWNRRRIWIRHRLDNQIFSYEYFERLLGEIISHGYAFLRVDQDPDAGGPKPFYLRHDVDLSHLAARKIGEIEHRLGVTSSFFFLLGGETYNLLGADALGVVRSLREMGHCVGLHIDERLIDVQEGKIKSTLTWFNDCVAEIDNVVSFHRPTDAVLGKDFSSFCNAYRSEIFAPDRYLSDSRRDSGFLPTLRQWMDEGQAPVQLLLHPGWYYPEPDALRFREDLLARRSREVDAYLESNFRKVFGGLGDSAHRKFEL